VPLEVANIIYEKYPNNPYGIRVDGDCLDCKPRKRATDDKYERDIQEYIELNLPSDEYLAKCRNAKRNLSRRSNENKYVGTYHIDTKEGLVILLTEMKDYLARKEGLKETEVERFDELMATINSEMLKKVNPSISTYEWMQADKENNEMFFQTVSRETKTTFGEYFRKAIDKFDQAVNPFMNKAIELDDFKNYLQKVNISASIYDTLDGKRRKDCCLMYITDLETKDEVRYYRRPDGFSYELDYAIGEEQYLTVIHYFSTSRGYENSNGEVIVIKYHGDNIPQEIDIRYNITKGIAGTTYGEKLPVTPEQKEFVYDELLKAIEIASSITINNMKKKDNPRKLTLD